MPTFSKNRQVALRLLITNFLTERLNGKLEKLQPNDPKRDELMQQFIPAVWLEDAARRSTQIQVVTHTLKPIHPDAKGTNLYCPLNTLPVLDVVGSHCLGDDFVPDVVGNAAALDVYKFLKQTHEGRSLLDLAIAEDADFAAALSDDPTQAQAWMQAFAALVQPRGRITSHTFAKQLYWAVDGDGENAENFHLLAPLYSSPLAHWMFARLQDDRFSEEAKAAREARKANTFSERAVHEYPRLAIQKLGGTKPQNISQLNSERLGNNSLLASLPPIWKTQGIKPLYHTESLFTRFGNRKAVRGIIKTIRDFLKTDPNPTVETRSQRAAYIDDLIDEFFQFSAELWELGESQAGWSQHDDCLLDSAQCHWLDPDGVPEPVPTDTNARIATAFANWLNEAMKEDGGLLVGDPEFFAWRKTMNDAIKAVEREGTYAA